MPESLAGANPYVGPRPFEPGQPLFGRDREVLELRYLLTSERIVLLYSPSGAGKSSLVNAGLIPKIEHRFEIWGPTRVNSQPPPGAANRYVWSAISGVSKSPAGTQVAPQVTWKECIAQRVDPRERPRNPLIIFDQFEEILRVDAVDTQAKRAFFEQTGEMLADPRIFALFIIREDYLAQLDPYARLIPTNFQNRYRIDRLSREAAAEAIENPTANTPRKYAPKVIETLVDNLAKVKVQGLDGAMREEVGPYVEPLQLQVVCFDLWDRMRPDDLSIDPEDVGEVSDALSNYYARSVRGVAGEVESAERGIRDWFNDQLITSDGVRNQVRQEQGQTGGLDNSLVQKLVDTYLVRQEPRGGSNWYELAHDRLVAPIRRDNAAWFTEHLKPVQQRAVQWQREGEPRSLLLLDQDLRQAEEWAQANKLNPREEDFLNASREAEQQRLAAEERRLKDIRTARILKAGAVMLAVLFVASVGALVSAWQNRNAAIASAQQAQKALAEYDLEKIPGLIDAEQPAQALAYLARALRGNPESLRARAWAGGFLSRGNLRIPSLQVDHQSPVTQIVFSGDGSRMLTTYARGSSRVWNVKTGQPAGPAFQGAPLGVLNQDGTLAILFDHNLTNDNPNSHLIDVASGKELGKAADASGGFLPQNIGQVEFSRNTRPRQAITTAFSQPVRLWDIDAFKAVRSPAIRGDVQFVAFNADRSVILVLLKFSAVVWKVSEIAGGTFPSVSFDSAVSSAALSPDGSRAAILTGSKAYVWNIASGLRAELSGAADAVSVGFTADGQDVVVAGRFWLQLWNAKTAKPNPLRWSTLNQVKFQSGQQVFSEAAGEAILLRDVRTWQPVAKVFTRGRLDNWALSPDGHTLAAAAGGRTTVEIWDVTPGPAPPAASSDDLRLVTTASAGAVVSKDGRRVLRKMSPADTHVDEPPEVDDAKTGERIMQLRLEGSRSAIEDTSYVGALSDDGNFAALVSSQGYAEVFDVNTGQLVGQPWSDWVGILALRFSPGGSHLITGAKDRTARLWEVTSGSAVGDPVIHTGPVAKVVLAPDGRRVLTSSGDGVSAWEVYLGSGSEQDANALAGLAEAAGGMRLAPDSTTPVLIPLAERSALYQDLSKSTGLDAGVAAAIARFTQR